MVFQKLCKFPTFCQFLQYPRELYKFSPIFKGFLNFFLFFKVLRAHVFFSNIIEMFCNFWTFIGSDEPFFEVQVLVSFKIETYFKKVLWSLPGALKITFPWSFHFPRNIQDFRSSPGSMCFLCTCKQELYKKSSTKLSKPNHWNDKTSPRNFLNSVSLHF